MAEEFDRGWYVRINGNPFAPTAPALFTQTQASEIEQMLIQDAHQQRKPR